MKRFASERVTGLMERLGLDDDVAIESRLVSRTIESAQSRVEGFNFDIRKRVVEYDDVINKQRETIYAERDKVLHNEDLTETVQIVPRRRGRRAGRRRTSSARIPASGTSRACRPRCAAMGLTGEGTTRRRPVGAAQSRGDREHIRDLADEQLAAKSAEVGEEDWKTVERLVLIRTIDSLWVEHLTELDDMRRGIGLRGYAQQDPLNEFKREAFQLYDELRGLIRHGVASSIFRVTVTRQPAPGPRVATRRSAASLAARSGRAHRRRTARTAGRPAGAAGRPAASGGRGPGGGRGRWLGHPARRPAGAAHHATDARIARRPAGRRRRRRSGRRPAARSPGSPRAARGSGGTIRAGAAPAPSTRSVTGADPAPRPLAQRPSP